MAVSLGVIVVSAGEPTVVLVALGGFFFAFGYLLTKGTVTLTEDRIVITTAIRTTVHCEDIEAVEAGEPIVFPNDFFFRAAKLIAIKSQRSTQLELGAPQTLLVLAKRRVVLSLFPLPCPMYVKRLRLCLTAEDEQRLVRFWQRNLNARGDVIAVEEVPDD
jgi:hypothetical protein